MQAAISADQRRTSTPLEGETEMQIVRGLIQVVCLGVDLVMGIVEAFIRWFLLVIVVAVLYGLLVWLFA